MRKMIKKLLDNWQLLLMLLLIGVVIPALCILIGINDNSTEKEPKHNESYYAGYEDGIGDAQKNFEYTEDYIDSDARDLYGLSPEEAIMILSNYSDGEPIPKQEVYKAIETIRRYYYDLQESINDIDSFSE